MGIGATLGLESKIEAGLEANLPQIDLLVKLTGKGATKVGGKVKINAIWKSVLDWEPQLKVGSSWDIFPPLEYHFDASSTTDLMERLVAYYPFNGSANDESGNGNHGIVSAATTTTDRFGRANAAYDFKGFGSSSHIKVLKSPSGLT